MKLLVGLILLILLFNAPEVLLFLMVIVASFALVIAWFWSLELIGEFDPILAIGLGILSLFFGVALIIIAAIGTIVSFFTEDASKLLGCLWIFVLVVLILL
ncbi:MAG: hypothetical protein HN981_04750 [Candidatus Pacebacteria bacterium]|jgi:hypothetical protein|nr:hypothetical protein [Candidatus Paceibacterota bacterium]MBT4652057.1 hypothetical protein [Candidatus Paceibacterota bacterium]MBT6756079.1 hypothetical protein [Candidatus Paceibacterota bacterium]MBT6921672.1 hypothetical protein [Candidatus Paceibacterota bacterium]